MGRTTMNSRRCSSCALVSLAGLTFVAGCSHAPMPDPKDAVRAYQAAAEKGDAQAIYGMLSKRSRSRVPSDVARIVADERSELAAQAKGHGDPGAVVRASARVRYADGEDATLALEEGGFRVSTADGLPAGAHARRRGPRAASSRARAPELRRAHARSCLRPRAAPSRAICARSSTGSSHPEGLEVQSPGDAASVQIPGGHFVKLRREGGSLAASRISIEPRV